MEIDIQDICERDIADITKIQNLSFHNKWSSQSVSDSVLSENSLSLLAKYDGQIVAFIIIKQILDEAEIISIAVLPEFRDMNIASQLLKKSGCILQSAGVSDVFLEVSCSNEGAQNLYLNQGFTITGRRKKYYPENGQLVDGIIMKKTLY